MQGPPLVLYGRSKGWNPRGCSATIFSLSLPSIRPSSSSSSSCKAPRAAPADFYYSYFCLTSLPGVLVGVACGQYVADRIDKGVFQFVVLGMCLCLGVNLLAAS